MDLTEFIFLAPLLGVGILFFVEKALLKRKTRWSKVVPTAVIQCINHTLSFSLPLFLLVPLVYLVAPLKVFSFSEWEVPIWFSFSACILFLDAVHYWSHRLHHIIPVLWRFHRLHHSDRNVDVFTTVLHHPFEVITGFVAVVVCAVILDVPVVVLMTYAAAQGLHSAFTHMNGEVPIKLDRFMKWIVVTPNFHRAHHSIDMSEGNSNFGAIFIYWDYIFRTASSGSRPEAMVFGISKDQAPKQDSIGSYLANPLR